jgi:hypothetical protein
MAAPKRKRKEFKIVNAVLRFVSNQVPLCWYNQRTGGNPSM